MQNHRLKPVLSLVSSAMLCIATLAPVSSLPASRAAAQQTRAVAQDSSKALRIVGVWDTQVTISDPQTGITLRNFRSRGPSGGRWEYLGNGRYTAVFRFFRFNPDGTFAGIQHVTQTVTIQPGAQEFTTEIAVELLDANDNVFRNLVGTATGARVVD